MMLRETKCSGNDTSVCHVQCKSSVGFAVMMIVAERRSEYVTLHFKWTAKDGP
jgi:hypothetical protein